MAINLGGSATTSAQIIAALGYTPADAGAVVMGDGSVSSPGMFFGSDTNTGFYKIAADTLGISAGGVSVASLGSTLATVGAYSTDISTGYMGLGRTDPGFWIDFNKSYTDIAAADAKMFFHMYGEVAASAETALGQLVGFYAHLDGDDVSLTSGKTVSSVYPLRGNLTWTPEGTLTLGAGILGTTRVIGSNGGVISNGYGGRFEVANEVAATGTITQAFGVSGEVRNAAAGVIMTGYGLRSLLTTTSAGGGITTGYGLFAGVSEAGGGIGSYFGVYLDSSIVADTNNWGLYSGGGVKSYHAGNFSIGTSSGSSTAKFLVTDSAASAFAGVFRESHASYAGTVVRLLADRAASNGFNFLTVEANSVVVASMRGDGRILTKDAINLGPTALTLVPATIGMNKVTTTGTAAGAAGARLEVVAGTNPGTAKLIMYAGTSTTPATIIDNVGSGVS